MQGFIEIVHENGMRDSVRSEMISNFWEEKQGNKKKIKLVLMNDFENSFDYSGTYEELQKAIQDAESPSLSYDEDEISEPRENETENARKQFRKTRLLLQQANRILDQVENKLSDLNDMLDQMDKQRSDKDAFKRD